MTGYPLQIGRHVSRSNAIERNEEYWQYQQMQPNRRQPQLYIFRVALTNNNQSESNESRGAEAYFVFRLAETSNQIAPQGGKARDQVYGNKTVPGRSRA